MSVVLDVQPDTAYEPSEAEMLEYGKWLGMELPADMPLLWIAREGLKAPLPENWKACKSEKGELYYFNFKTGQSIWDHPSDEHYRELLKSEKAKLAANRPEPEQAEQPAPSPSTAEPSSKGAKKKKGKGKDADSLESTSKPRADENKGVCATPPSKVVERGPAPQPKRQLPAPGKLASLAPIIGKAEKNGGARATSPEFPSTTSQSDSSLASDPPRVLKIDQPDAIPLPEKVVAGGGVNGLRALDKLNVPSSANSPTAAAKASSKSSLKEPKSRVDEKVAKEMAIYKAEQQKALTAAADRELERDLDAYKDERRASLTAEVDAELERDLDAYRAEQQDSLRRRKEEIESVVSEEVKQCQDRLNSEKQRQRGSSDKQLADALRTESQKLDAELEAKLISLRREYEAKRAVEASRLREKLTAQLDHDKRKIEGELAQVLETFTREKRQESEITKEAQARVLQEAGMDASEIKQCAAAFISQYEQALSSFLKAVQSSKNVLDQASAQKRQQLELEADAKLEQTLRDHEERWQETRERMSKELDILQKDHASEVASLKLSQQQELQKLRDDFVEQRNQNQKEQVSLEHDRFMQTLTGIQEAQAKELDALKQQLKAKAEEELHTVMRELTKEKQPPVRDSNNVLRLSASYEPSVRARPSASGSPTDDDEAFNKDKSPAPRLDGKLLASPAQEESVAVTPSAQSQSDIKTVITEALREVFAGSPFILPSSGHNGDNRSAPPTPAAVSRRTPELQSSAALVNEVPQGNRRGGQSAAVLHMPLSCQEQRDLVDGERRRLQDGRRYVELQERNLEERKQQLKRTRHQWKQDVLSAKAEGVRSSTKRGQLLNKVRLSLEEQARGLEHDLLILRDSQVWLLSKEQRLLSLERQIEEQERMRGGGDASAMHNCSVDTAALMTGYFKPQRYGERAYKDGGVSPTRHLDPARRGSLGSGSLALDGYTSSPILSTALTRIEQRLDEVTSIMHLQQQLQQQQGAAPLANTPYAANSRRQSIAQAPAARDIAASGRTRHSSRSQSKQDLLRRESHLDQWHAPEM